MFIKIRCFKYTAKKNIYYKIIKNYKLTISNEIINEGNKRNIIEKIQKKNEVNNEANKRNNYDENIISNQALNTVNKRNIGNKIPEDNNDYDIITNELTKKEKMDFYYSVMDNNVEKFKSYINGTNSGKPYNILEEVSARGYDAFRDKCLFSYADSDSFVKALRNTCTCGFPPQRIVNMYQEFLSYEAGLIRLGRIIDKHIFKI